MPKRQQLPRTIAALRIEIKFCEFILVGARLQSFNDTGCIVWQAGSEDEHEGAFGEEVALRAQ